MSSRSRAVSPRSTLTRPASPAWTWDVNPNGSVMAIEGITSPDGRVLGKMGHVERRGDSLYKNVPGNKFMPLFESGVRYFTD